MATKHKDSMLRHLRKVKPCTASTKYVCAQCNTSFNRKYDYLRHMERSKPCVPRPAHDDSLVKHISAPSEEHTPEIRGAAHERETLVQTLLLGRFPAEHILTWIFVDMYKRGKRAADDTTLRRAISMYLRKADCHQLGWLVPLALELESAEREDFLGAITATMPEDDNKRVSRRGTCLKHILDMVSGTRPYVQELFM